MNEINGILHIAPGSRFFNHMFLPVDVGRDLFTKPNGANIFPKSQLPKFHEQEHVLVSSTPKDFQTVHEGEI